MRTICNHCNRPMIYHFWMEMCCSAHPPYFASGIYCDDGVLYVEDYNDVDAYFFLNTFAFGGQRR